MRHVDLCSGIGGFALGFEWAGLSHPVLFCDIEPWSRQVLAKHWPDVPITDDVKELASDAGRLVPDCEILSCGYPCQPFSQAGKRAGEKDDRHIWPEIFAIIKAKRPRWVVCENVSGHITLGLDQVLSDLEGEGYAIQPFVIPACAVDAPHRRDRVWIVAHAESHGQPDGTINEKQGCGKLVAHAGCQRQGAEVSGFGGQSINGSAAGQWTETRDGFADSRENVADTSREQNYEQRRVSERKWRTLGWSEQASQQEKRQTSADSIDRCGEDVADTDSQRGCGRDAQGQDAKTARQSPGHQRHDTRGMETWLPEPAVGRVANGIPRRVDRLKGLGNAIVPQIAMRIGQTIKAVEDGQV